MDRSDMKRVVGDTTHVAQEKGKEALLQAQVYLEQAQDYLSPRAHDALNQAQEFVTPLAKDARKKGAALAAQTMDTLQPRLEEALERVSPAVEDAYSRLAPALDAATLKVQREILPRLNEILHEAADNPVALEASERAQATVAALSGELRVPDRRSGNAAATALKVIVASGLLAGVVIAIKKFLEPQDSGWQAHEPSEPYVPTTPSDLVGDVSEKFDDATVADAAEDLAETTTDAPEGDAAPFAPSPYGAGSFVGAEPPEGFLIKGNERSMKYHVPGNGGYERTIADVWFDDEEAAQAAGFSKAQR